MARRICRGVALTANRSGPSTALARTSKTAAQSMPSSLQGPPRHDEAGHLAAMDEKSFFSQCGTLAATKPPQQAERAYQAWPPRGRRRKARPPAPQKAPKGAAKKGPPPPSLSPTGVWALPPATACGQRRGRPTATPAHKTGGGARPPPHRRRRRPPLTSPSGHTARRGTPEKRQGSKVPGAPLRTAPP